MPNFEVIQPSDLSPTDFANTTGTGQITVNTGPGTSVGNALAAALSAGSGIIDIANVKGADREFPDTATRDTWASTHTSLLSVGMYCYTDGDNKTWKLSSISPVVWADVTPPIAEANYGVNLTTSADAVVYAGMQGAGLTFKAFKAGSGVSINDLGTAIQINAGGGSSSSGSVDTSNFLLYDSCTASGSYEVPVVHTASTEMSGVVYTWDAADNGQLTTNNWVLPAQSQFPGATLSVQFPWLVINNKLAVPPYSSPASGIIKVSQALTSAWTLSLNVTGLKATPTSNDGSREFWIYFRFQDAYNNFRFGFAANGVLQLQKLVNGTATTLSAPAYVRQTDIGGANSFSMLLTVVRDQITCQMASGTPVSVYTVASVTDSTFLSYNTSLAFGGFSTAHLVTPAPAGGYYTYLDTIIVKDLSSNVLYANASASGAPTNVPNFVGQVYVDKSTTPRSVYIATDVVAASDWVKVN
jgi:hypothetical protein